MFKLLNRDEQYIEELEPIEATHKEVLNGENYLQLKLDGSVEIEKKYRIITYSDKYNQFLEFIVEGITVDRTDNTIDVYAENSFYELLGDFIEGSKANNTTANIALERALINTRWEIARVDDLGLSGVEFYRTNAKDAVQRTAERWNGELKYYVELSENKITHRYIELLKKRGDDIGERFEVGENVEKLSSEINTDNIVTALYGFGRGEEVGDGFGRRLDFGSINSGKMYVEDLEALEKYGRLNSDGSKSHIFGKIEFDDIEDKTELLALTIAELERLKEPIVTYRVDVKDLVSRLGDSVTIVDSINKEELRLSARVLEIEHDLLNRANDKVTLGNYINTLIDDMNNLEGYINSFRDKANIWDRANSINADGTFKTEYLDDLVGELNDRLNASGGYVYLNENGKGITTYDKPIDQSPTQAVQILGGALRVANDRLPNGEFNYRTFITGKGVTADLINTGILRGGKVKFDLTNGTLLIGNSIEDYSLLFDGQELHLKLGNGKSLEQNFKDVKTELYEYVQSRGDNLVTNGTGSLGNNYNFSQMKYDQSDNQDALGSFTYSNRENSIFTDEKIPINSELEYKMSYYIKANPLPEVGQSRHFGMVTCFDADGDTIQARHNMYVPGTLTELTQDLKPGDTEIHLLDATNWVNSRYSWESAKHSIMFWNYTNKKGYTYAPETYTRNISKNDLWGDTGINYETNTITLLEPYEGETYPAGTKVSNNDTGGSFKYITAINDIVTDDWVKYEGTISGTDYTGQNDYNKFAPGTAFVKLGWILNSGNPIDSTTWLSNIRFEQNFKGKIDELETRVTEAELKVTNDAIISTVQNSTLLDDVMTNDDLQQTTNAIVSSFGSIVDQRATSIKQEVKAEYTDLITQTKQENQASIDLTSQDLNIKIDATNRNLSDVNKEVNTISSSFKFNEEGLTIGKSNSPLNITISNKEMQLKDNGQVVAYINGQKMFINTLQVTDSFTIGVHQLENYEDKFTIAKWVGQN